MEKNRKPGVKILISGGTRCNLTHACDERGIVAAFGSAGRFLHSALAALGPRELVELVEAEGVPTYVEAGTGKVFPDQQSGRRRRGGTRTPARAQRRRAGAGRAGPRRATARRGRF